MTPPRIRLVSRVPCPPTPTIIIFFVIIFSIPTRCVFCKYLSQLRRYCDSAVFCPDDLRFDLLKRAEAAHLHAQAAAVAHSGINADTAVFVLCESGASGLQAGAAVDTFLRKRLHLVRMYFALEQRAGCLGDDDGQLFLLCLFLEDLCEFLGIERIDNLDVLDADALDQSREMDSRDSLAGQGLACSGMVLVACHTSRAVVKNDDCAVGLVVVHIDQRIDAGVHEGGITDDSDPVLDIVVALCLLHAVQGGDAGAHADSGVDNCQRRQGAQCVASDVACCVQFKLFEHGIGCPVGASGTEDGRTGRNLGSRLNAQIHTQNALSDHVGAVLALDGEELLADAVDAPCADLLLDDRLKFLKDVENIDWSSADRSTFTGAFRYLLNQIQAINPFIKEVIAGYFQNTIRRLGNVGYYGDSICEMQELIGEHYDMSVMKAWEHTQINGEFVSGTSNYIADFNSEYGTSYTPMLTDAQGNIPAIQLYCPDTIHPHTDKTGNTNKRLNAVYTKLLAHMI